jgi:hypothetical protein
MNRHRSVLDITTDADGISDHKIIESCHICGRRRQVHSWHLEGCPDSWSPSDLKPKCRDCADPKPKPDEEPRFRWQ